MDNLYAGKNILSVYRTHSKQIDNFLCTFSGDAALLDDGEEGQLLGLGQGQGPAGGGGYQVVAGGAVEEHQADDGLMTGWSAVSRVETSPSTQQ